MNVAGTAFLGTLFSVYEMPPLPPLYQLMLPGLLFAGLGLELGLVYALAPARTGLTLHSTACGCMPRPLSEWTGSAV